MKVFIIKQVCKCRPKKHRKVRHVRLSFGPFSEKGSVFTMPASVTCPQGQSFDVTLKPVPDGASFAGTPTLVSSDPSVVSVSDNGDGTGVATAVGTTDGATATITGTDTGNGFSDSGDVTIGVGTPPPTQETGVALSFGTPHP